MLRMKKRHLMLLSLFIVIIVIIGCSGTSSFGRWGRQGRTGIDASSNPDYRVGAEGLTVEYAPGSLDRAFERDVDIKFVVEVRNKGAFPQPDDVFGLNAHLWVYGFDKNILDIFPDETILDDSQLEGKNPFNNEGGFQAVVLSGTVFDLPQGTPVYEPKIITAVSYEYETVASAEVCVDPFPYSTSIRDKICDVNDFQSVNVKGSQGAPVAISRLEEQVTNDALLFKIYIRNVGNGIIIPIADVSKNPKRGYDYDTQNEVRVSEITIGNIPMTSCRPYAGDRIKLINDEGFMVCKFSTIGIDNVYTTPINVRLEYGYVSSIEKQIQILEEIGI